jgi:peptidyl-prolyl cis-trans isomerase SurA
MKQMQTLCAALTLAAFGAAPAMAQMAKPGIGLNAGSPYSASIAAVVNGQVITDQDVNNRAALLSLSIGMQPSTEVLARLRPQVMSQLIDQTLQLQEIEHRNVTVAETDVEAAIAHIEQSNGLQPGGLRARLAAAGIPFSTLVAQLRTEVGWQTVLHQILGPGLQPTQGDMDAEKAALKAELGSTQYHISEIFVPVTDPANDASARNFANTVIGQLRAGAPFPIVATQFSQSPSALQGGNLGYVQLSQLDPAVAALVTSMPAGAISNPVRVPGGYDIVQLQGTHKFGADQQTILSVRQAFARFPTPITNGQVGPVQAAAIGKLVQSANAARSCSAIAALNASLGNVHPADPGPVNLATVTPPAFQTLLSQLPVGQASRPLVESDGASVVMVCNRTTEAEPLPSDVEITNIIVERRVELESQQLRDELRHRSIITQN